MSVTLVRNGKSSYILDGCVDIDNLTARLGVVDTDREVFMTNGNNFEPAGVKDVGHWGLGFDKKCGVGWGKLHGQLPAL